MSGRKRIDMLTEQVARLERVRMTAPLEKWLATLSSAELDTVEAWIEANAHTLELRIEAGEDPLSILKGTRG